MAQVQTTSIRQHQSPQQYLISTMIQSTTDELLQLINQEVEKNVALEAVDPREVSLDAPAAEPGGEEDSFGDDGNTEPSATELPAPASDTDSVSYFEYDDDSPSDQIGTRRADADDFTPGQNTATEDSFREDLKHQVDELDITAEEAYLAHYIIDSLDENGYMSRPLAELVDDLEFTQRHLTTEEDLEAVLVEIVQAELEPSGIGARNLQECMLLQLQEQKGPVARLAYLIVQEAFQSIADNRWDRIEQAFGITNHQVLVDIRRKIHHLNPKPGDMQHVAVKSTAARIQQVIPDFTVLNEDGQLVVYLKDEHIPVVRVSDDSTRELELIKGQVEEKLKSGNKASADEKQEGVRYLRDAIQDARTFIDALNQRRRTLVEVMQVIVNMQRAYFITGQTETLVPMKLQDVADRCQYDISTISRVSNSKYVQTEFGVFPIKDLFQSAIDDTNQRAMLEALEAIIQAEDKLNPLTDDALVTVMKQQGYTLARRTVAKYRDMLGYPTARLRKGV